jgi:hypothetical protein
VATDITPTTPGWAIDVHTHLTADAANLIAISATASSDTAYISYKLAAVLTS